MNLVFLVLCLFPLLMVVAGLHDLTTMKIPNWISILLVVAFFPAALASGLPMTGLAVHVSLGVFALLVGAAMFAMNWIGGGDAKLMAVACLWLGLAGSGLFLLWMALAGGALTLGLLFARRHVPALSIHGPAWVKRLMEPQGDIPYGVAIAVGALLVFPASDVISAYIANV